MTKPFGLLDEAIQMLLDRSEEERILIAHVAQLDDECRAMISMAFRIISDPEWIEREDQMEKET